MRRAATVLLTTVLTAGGMAALAPGASAATDIQPRDLTIIVTGVGPGGQSCKIDANLYVPPGVSAQRPAPAVLTTNGFGGTKDDQDAYAQSFAERGYVTLAYTGLGFVDGDNCPITLDDVQHDGAAASQLIRFLGGDRSIEAYDDVQPGKRVYVDQVVREDRKTGVANDPQVGMVGGSYGGQIQFATAGYEHKQRTNRLDAIVPQITWNDLSYSLAPENSGIPRGTARSGSVSSPQTGLFKYQWAGLFTTLGIENGAQDLASVSDPEEAQKYIAAAATSKNCANFEPQVCQALAEVAAQGYPSKASIAYLRSNSVSSYISDVRVPTLLGQGQADTLFNLQESVANYTKLKSQGTPVALQWQSWGHSDSTPVAGELDERHLEKTVQGRSILAWFDYYVRDRGTAPAQNFSYFRDWVYTATGNNAAKAYATAPGYPVGTEKTWYLSGGQSVPAVGGAVVGRPAALVQGGGSLVTDRRAVLPGTSSFTSPSPIGPNYSETSYLDQSQPVQDPPGTAFSFAGPVLARPLDVVGSPRVTVRLASPTALPGTAGQLVVYAKLYDVGPDGKPVELPNRLISPARVADVNAPITIELAGIVHRFEAGHRLALVIAGGDMAYRGSNVRHVVTLTVDPAKPQTLTVPVVNG